MTKKLQLNSYQSKNSFQVQGKVYHYFSIPDFEAKTKLKISRLPYSLKILLENLLRHEDGVVVTKKEIESLANWDPKGVPCQEIQFMPGRILMQDFTGVPAVADLAAMRKAMARLGGDPSQINPLQPADLVIDHSVQVDFHGMKSALAANSKLEFDRNQERYEFLKWAQKSFNNFRVIPPDTGIVHQVNLEYLSHVVMCAEWTSEGKSHTLAYPDTLVGTDSHTTMINGLGVLGWGVGGIEAEAAMLGQPCSMLIPQVVGVKLRGSLSSGCTATDLVLVVTETLRKKGVVGKFVEFFGPGLKDLTLPDRATVANMAPEYGATLGLFPVDQKTLDYFKLTAREEKIEVIEKYYRCQKMWYQPNQPEADYSDIVEIDLNLVTPSLAGPSRPQDRVVLSDVPSSFRNALPNLLPKSTSSPLKSLALKTKDGLGYELKNGSVVISAITSCTNTSNPTVLITAGLLAKNAVARGLRSKPWVKTSFAPGSKVVTDFITQSGLMPYFEALGFHIIGYGCTTCIGNSGPLSEDISEAVSNFGLAVASVLSGNRNFEGRVHPLVRANYLASPPLCVAYAIVGTLEFDLTRDPIGYDTMGTPVTLKDIWPDPTEVSRVVQQYVTLNQYKEGYQSIFLGDSNWQKLPVSISKQYDWKNDSTYIKEPPFFQSIQKRPEPIEDLTQAKVLAWFGDSITTDHISPAGNIAKISPAGLYLQSLGVKPTDFNSYGARRGNHEVMMRGTFANTRIKNLLVPGTEGGITRYLLPSPNQDRPISIFDAAMKYQTDKTPLLIIAGKEYGSGSSRDWAAKGPKLLGVRAVIAESYERIHRSNLVGMGILPLQFQPEENFQLLCEKLGLNGTETFQILNVSQITPGQKVEVVTKTSSGTDKKFTTVCRIDTPNEVEYFRNGGILPYVLRQMMGN